MDILQDDESWATGTWAVADDAGRPVAALSVVGQGGTVIRFADDAEGGFGPLVDAEADLRALLDREVDLVERSALERSGNYIRRRSILSGLHNVYAA